MLCGKTGCHAFFLLATISQDLYSSASSRVGLSRWFQRNPTYPETTELCWFLCIFESERSRGRKCQFLWNALKTLQNMQDFDSRLVNKRSPKHDGTLSPVLYSPSSPPKRSISKPSTYLCPTNNHPMFSACSQRELQNITCAMPVTLLNHV